MADNELRFSKIDDAIQRLATVAADLSKMLAVHEQRITQQEKTADLVANLIESRRIEFEEKIAEVYDIFRKEDNQILNEIKEFKTASSNQHKEMQSKIQKIEKLIWMVTGGGMAIGFIISMFLNFYKVFTH
jgi:paraquat-inducible protein B